VEQGNGVVGTVKGGAVRIEAGNVPVQDAVFAFITKGERQKGGEGCTLDDGDKGAESVRVDEVMDTGTVGLGEVRWQIHRASLR
jgi:hypothetical protein